MLEIVERVLVSDGALERGLEAPPPLSARELCGRGGLSRGESRRPGKDEQRPSRHAYLVISRKTSRKRRAVLSRFSMLPPPSSTSHISYATYPW